MGTLEKEVQTTYTRKYMTNAKVKGRLVYIMTCIVFRGLRHENGNLNFVCDLTDILLGVCFLWAKWPLTSMSKFCHGLDYSRIINSINLSLFFNSHTNMMSTAR